MNRLPVLVCGVTVVLAACSSDGPDADALAADLDADVVVEAVDIGYAPDRIEVPAGEVVQVGLVNTGALRHNLVLPDGTTSETMQAAGTTVVEIGPLDETVTAWCSIPGHRTAGMELDIVPTE